MTGARDIAPEVLVEVSIGDLLQRLDIVDRNQVRVHVHKLDLHLLERALREQVTLDAAERFVRVVVRLLHEPELLSLRLVESVLHRVRLLEPLERENQQLRVVLVRERRERDVPEPPRLEPVHRCGVDGHGLRVRA